MSKDLKPGDIVLVTSDGFVAWMIRRFRSRDGKPTYVNHVGLIVEEGSLATAVMLDAQPPRIQRRRLGVYSGSLVAIYRPRLPQRNINNIVARALFYDQRLYGIGKIVLHFLGLSGLSFFDKQPICSWTVAIPFQEEGYSFGVSGTVARPDDIHDFVRSRPHLYTCIKELSLLNV